MMAKGDAAIDFELRDIEGRAYRLSELLKDKPVVMIWGMYTCPAFQVR
jgi:peroxiredoxin